jgi:hypothetical protein
MHKINSAEIMLVYALRTGIQVKLPLANFYHRPRQLHQVAH